MLDMLDELDRFEIAEKGAARSPRKLPLDVEILSVATATPEYKVTQAEALERVARISPSFAKFSGIFANSGIETRYSCVPPEWVEQNHGWKERMDVYRHHAINLLDEVARKAIAAAGLAIEDIDVLVTNSTTGISVPSIDALVINRLKFKETVTRLPIFGLGCSGGAAGLARAAQFAQSMPNANVLFLTIDLCSLAARPFDRTIANFASASLFGDGAAGIVLRRAGTTPRKTSAGRPAPRVVATGEHLWHDTENYLALNMEDDGFGMVLSAALPTLMQKNLGPAVESFLLRNTLSLDEFDGFLIHAGGRKILETAELILGSHRHQMVHAWSVMRDFGNMSSATVLFVLERAVAAGASGRHLLAAFGFGFSAHFAVVDL